MIRLFINGQAASAGGGLTYLRNVVPHLARRSEVQVSILLSSSLRSEFGELPNISFLGAPDGLNPARRFWFEQAALANLIRRSRAQLLVSAGNFALLRSPVPQILLSRNSLYTSSDFLRDVRVRGEYALWADTKIKAWFARQSIARADLTIAPSEAFARELSQWAGRTVIALHHGFDPRAFSCDSAPLPAEVQAQLAEGEGALRLLFVSHYNYYRNFETLFRAIPLLKQQLEGHPVKLYLTCRLSTRDNPGSYRAESAAALVTELRGSRDVLELGSIPYRSLHHLYRACHIYVTPAYAESFAHPLVEAMSSGIPVVASDLPVHREICGEAALYFPRFSPENLAQCVLRLHESSDLSARLSTSGLEQAKAFSWERHVDRLLELANELVSPR